DVPLEPRLAHELAVDRAAQIRVAVARELAALEPGGALRPHVQPTAPDLRRRADEKRELDRTPGHRAIDRRHRDHGVVAFAGGAAVVELLGEMRDARAAL